jgi:ATP adenylyltransferase
MKQLWAPWRMVYILNELEDKKGCIFCELPKETDDKKNLIVFRSEFCFVIMNKYPYNNGHVLVVPYEHTSDYTALNDQILLDIQKTVQKTIAVIKKVMSPQAMNIGLNLGRTAGAGIDQHLHYHIVPRWDGDTNFMPVISDTKVVSEALDATRDKLADAFERLYGADAER